MIWGESYIRGSLLYDGSFKKANISLDESKARILPERHLDLWTSEKFPNGGGGILRYTEGITSIPPHCRLWHSAILHMPTEKSHCVQWGVLSGKCV